MWFRPLTNFFTGTGIFKKIVGFAPERGVPLLSEVTLKGWMKRRKDVPSIPSKNGRVYLFADEFTNFNESDLGIKAIILLEKLGYEVIIPSHIESGRTFLSKGMLDNARKTAERNIKLLSHLVTGEAPLIGIEPSAILSFRDEYPEIANGSLKEKALALAKNSLLIEEFICREFDKGKIRSDQFTDEKNGIRLHGHCQQKAIASTDKTIKMMSIPANFLVTEIPSGCCGMAGAFGYEKEHYELSLKIGELVLFPEVRKAGNNTIIAAPGTSCRHQIIEGTGRKAIHPVEVLYNALLKN